MPSQESQEAKPSNPAFLQIAETRELIEIGEFLPLGSEYPMAGLQNLSWLAPRHARIERKPEGFLLRDLRSPHGSFVNGTKVSEAWLQEGDEIQLGPVLLYFTQKKFTPLISGIGLHSRNPNWQAQLERLGAVAMSPFPVLVLGPSGSGKEIIAERLHQHSPRGRGPFVRVNCSALTETLIESELFGHVRGSFTDAIGDRKGAFEAARGGTLFLDEIGDLPYPLQAKLLRALENNEIRPVGSDRAVRTDVRIVAATHQNLTEKIEHGEFRRDLYYRLNVISVSTPALIDRMEDFEDLLYTFARQLRVRFSFNAIQKLKEHRWPGNVRELKNSVARASALFPRQQIEAQHVPQIVDEFHCESEDTVAEALRLPPLREVERQMIIRHLAANRGNQRRAALELGMPKSTLHDRLKLYRIDPMKFRHESRL